MLLFLMLYLLDRWWPGVQILGAFEHLNESDWETIFFLFYVAATHFLSIFVDALWNTFFVVEYVAIDQIAKVWVVSCMVSTFYGSGAQWLDKFFFPCVDLLLLGPLLLLLPRFLLILLLFLYFFYFFLSDILFVLPLFRISFLRFSCKQATTASRQKKKNRQAILGFAGWRWWP